MKVSLKVTSETNSTLYKTALFENSSTELEESDASDLDHYDTAQWNESSVLILENEESDANEIEGSEIPSHLSEHNYNVPVPHDQAPDLPALAMEQETEASEESKRENLSVLNETSLFYEADEIESSYYDESPIKAIQPNETEVAQTPIIEPEYSDDQNQSDEQNQLSSTPTKPIPLIPLKMVKMVKPRQLKNPISVQFDVDSNSAEIEDHECLNRDDIERYQDDANDPSWLDDTNFESDEDELDAIQNMIKTENETMNDSIKEEEEINDFIQKEFAMQEKENEELENASKLFQTAVKDMNNKHEDFKNFVGSNQDSTANLLEEDVDNFLINDLLKSDEDDLEKGVADKTDKNKLNDEEERGLSDARGDMRYEPDPFLPEGWKQATYFVKKTGIETHKFMSPDGQKFTSRKLMLFFMKTKGYGQEVLDRVMEGTKCKRRASKGASSAEESLEEAPPPEQQRKKVIRERFITSLAPSAEKEDNKRKRQASEDNRVSKADSSQNYNADISANVESSHDGGEKKRRRGRPRKEENTGVVIKKEPDTSILETGSTITERPVRKNEDESSIGPKMTISKQAFKQLSALFLKSPIPSNSELASISKSTEVSAKDVKWWFIKIRHKVKMNKVEKDDVRNYLDSVRICNFKNGVISL